MSVDSNLDRAIALILQKANRPGIDPAIKPLTINWTFSAGGSAVVTTACAPLLVEIPYPCTIVWAHMYSGVQTGGFSPVTSAIVDVIMTQLDTPDRYTHLYGDGTIPTMTSASTADLDLTGWHVNLITGDTLIARLQTFSAPTTPIVSWLSLVLLCRPTDVPIGVATVEDLASDGLIDSTGADVVLRG